jgi:hypothetical protein
MPFKNLDDSFYFPEKVFAESWDRILRGNAKFILRSYSLCELNLKRGLPLSGSRA